LIQASFVIAGPDYVSMAAGEAENPRKVMPKAFNGVFYRLTAFFVLGALCVVRIDRSYSLRLSADLV
jgi:amino acid transporter